MKPAERTHALLGSIDELLAPETLTALQGTPVTSVKRSPFGSVDSLSGSRFLLVETTGAETRSYILKRIAVEWDWIMRATGDTEARAVRAWETGLLDLVPVEIDHGVVACARDGNGWAILTRDFRGATIPPGDEPITVEEHEILLNAMAALHVAFWGRPELAPPSDGFLDAAGRYRELTPEVGLRESNSGEAIPPMIVEGWNLLWTVIDEDVAGVLRPLLDDPTPLARALASYPQVVLHGDWKLGNLGIVRGVPPRVVLLDWAVVGPGAPAIDLAWYLAVNSARLPVPKERAIDFYRERLADRLGPRFDESWWRPQLDLALLGGFLQLAWPKALGAVRGDSEEVRAREQAELAWWSQRVRVAAPLL
jgi:hypothetical protein